MKQVAIIRGLIAAGAGAWAVAIPGAALLGGRSPAAAHPVLALVVYLAGAVVCHQRPERSFHLAGQALPVCARCTGIYEAAALTALLMWAALRFSEPRRRPWLATPSDAGATRTLVLCSLAPTAATVLWEWGVGSTPSNLLRACAGLPIGAVGAWVVMRSARVGGQSG